MPTSNPSYQGNGYGIQQAISAVLVLHYPLGNAVAWGIIAEAFERGLDPADGKQRKMATAYLLERVSWAGISSDFKIDLTTSRTRQLCEAMTVSKDLMANFLLAAGGRGGISIGGGGSTNELTTGMARRRILAGEFKVIRCFLYHLR